jgi:hypothetical protein
MRDAPNIDLAFGCEVVDGGATLAEPAPVAVSSDDDQAAHD